MAIWANFYQIFVTMIKTRLDTDGNLFSHLNRPSQRMNVMVVVEVVGGDPSPWWRDMTGPDMLWSLDELEVSPRVCWRSPEATGGDPCCGGGDYFNWLFTFPLWPGEIIWIPISSAPLLLTAGGSNFQLKQSSALSSACCLIGVRETQIRNTWTNLLIRLERGYTLNPPP